MCFEIIKREIVLKELEILSHSKECLKLNDSSPQKGGDKEEKKCSPTPPGYSWAGRAIKLSSYWLVRENNKYNYIYRDSP